MLWVPNGPPIEFVDVGDLDPDEVLIFFDGPKLFVSKVAGKALLVYESAVDEATSSVRFIAAPTSERILALLKSGEISVFRALDQAWVYAVTQSFDGEFVSASLLSRGIRGAPKDARPHETTLLWPHLAAHREPVKFGGNLRPEAKRYKLERVAFAESEGEGQRTHGMTAARLENADFYFTHIKSLLAEVKNQGSLVQPYERGVANHSCDFAAAVTTEELRAYSRAKRSVIVPSIDFVDPLAEQAWATNKPMMRL